MKLKDIQNTFHRALDSMYGKEEVDSFFFMLIESYYGVSRIQLAMDPDYAIDGSEKILNALELLKQHVLIPRPETEELVAWVLKKNDGNNPINILDIGTGSGCIAISLAKNLPNAKVYALDVSAEALKIAKQNADLNDVNVEFIEADILKTEDGRQKIVAKFNIIVSNPPYIRAQEKELMKANVIDNEPHLALFVKDKNPLLFYEAITQFASNNLTNEGQLFFEINEYLGNDMIELLNDNDFRNIELKQDIFRKDRMIKGEKIDEF